MFQHLSHISVLFGGLIFLLQYIVLLLVYFSFSCASFKFWLKVRHLVWAAAIEINNIHARRWAHFFLARILLWGKVKSVESGVLLGMGFVVTTVTLSKLQASKSSGIIFCLLWGPTEFSSVCAPLSTLRSII